MDVGRSDRLKAHIDDLIKPIGSLGRLEELALRIGIIYGDPPPALDRRCVLLLAADHGVAAAGVSAYPASVTAQMCGAIAAGKAAINVIARACGATVIPIDVGVNSALAIFGMVHRRVRAGSRNFAEGPALTPQEVQRAIAVGHSAVTDRLDEFDLFALGELGIGNTTSAAAVTGALLGVDAAQVCGRGTGVDDETFQRKVRIVANAVARIPAGANPLDVLAEVGGFEICAIAGAVIACAEHRRAVVTDGFIATAGVLAAAIMRPAAVDFVFASHRSPEPGHSLQLDRLGLQPLFDLGLRLGEGTGAVLALPMLSAAAGLLRDMGTFSSAGISNKPMAASS